MSALTSSITDKLLERASKAEVAILEKAFAAAETAHAGQLRKSGDPYITCLLYTSDAADD
jgi:(p)ppGpp synthase/HD superfamily hydrolase